VLQGGSLTGKKSYSFRKGWVYLILQKQVPDGRMPSERKNWPPTARERDQLCHLETGGINGREGRPKGAVTFRAVSCKNRGGGGSKNVWEKGRRVKLEPSWKLQQTKDTDHKNGNEGIAFGALTITVLKNLREKSRVK